mgnify:CR=1 FL=1
MTELTVRPAVSDDVPALHELVHGAYRGDSARRGWTHEADLLDGNRVDVQTLAAIVADPSQVVLLAERDGGLVGCVQVTDKGRGLAYLGMLTVDPALQGAGLGRALIAAPEAAAPARFRARTMEMTVIAQRAGVVAWYGRRGYLPTGETRPFPATDPRFGTPKRDDLAFVVLARDLT